MKSRQRTTTNLNRRNCGRTRLRRNNRYHSGKLCSISVNGSTNRRFFQTLMTLGGFLEAIDGLRIALKISLKSRHYYTTSWDTRMAVFSTKCLWNMPVLPITWRWKSLASMLQTFRSLLLLRIRHNLAMRGYNAAISNFYSKELSDLVLYTNTQSTFMALKNNEPKLVYVDAHNAGNDSVSNCQLFRETSVELLFQLCSRRLVSRNCHQSSDASFEL